MLEYCQIVAVWGDTVPSFAFIMCRADHCPDPPATIAYPSSVTRVRYTSSSMKNSPIFVCVTRSNVAT